MTTLTHALSSAIQAVSGPGTMPALLATTRTDALSNVWFRTRQLLGWDGRAHPAVPRGTLRAVSVVLGVALLGGGLLLLRHLPGA